MYSSWRCSSAWPPPSITGISAVTTNSPASSLVSSALIRSGFRRPPGRDLLVAAGREVDPRRVALQLVVDRRSQLVDVAAPQRQSLRALHRLDPHAAHLRLDLAVAVGPDAAARAVAQRLGARHRARQPGVVQHALTAHAAVPDRLLDEVLERGDDALRAGVGGW